MRMSFWIALVICVCSNSVVLAKDKPPRGKKKPAPVVTPAPTPEVTPTPQPPAEEKKQITPVQNTPVQSPPKQNEPVQDSPVQIVTPTPKPSAKLEEYSLLFVQRNVKTESDQKGLAQAGVGINYWRYPNEGKTGTADVSIVHLQGSGVTGSGVSGFYVEGDMIQFFGKTAALMEDGIAKDVRFSWGTGAEFKADVLDGNRAHVLAGISLAGVMMVGDCLFIGPEVALDYGEIGDYLNTKAGIKGKYVSPGLKVTGEMGGRSSWQEASAQDYTKFSVEVHVIKLNNINISLGAQYSNSTIKRIPQAVGEVVPADEKRQEIRLSTMVGF